MVLNKQLVSVVSESRTDYVLLKCHAGVTQQTGRCDELRHVPFQRQVVVLTGAHKGQTLSPRFPGWCRYDRSRSTDTACCSWSKCSRTSYLDQSTHSISSGHTEEVESNEEMEQKKKLKSHKREDKDEKLFKQLKLLNSSLIGFLTRQQLYTVKHSQVV